MTTDFRALCAELADAYLRLLEYINNSTWLGYEPSDDPLLLRARAALADEPAVPDGREPAAVVEQPKPVPVSERLPGPEDCDAEGRCWFLRFPFDYSRESWSLEDRTYGCNTGFTHWLPAHALPLPGQEVEE